MTETIDRDSFSKESSEHSGLERGADRPEQRGASLVQSEVASQAATIGVGATFGGDAGAGDSRVVTARGTEDGLVLRIDGKADWQEILCDIDLFLGGRKKFFEGGQVSLEWLDRLPTLEQSKELETLLHSAYGIEVIVRRRRPARMALAEPSARRAEYSSDPTRTPDYSRGDLVGTADSASGQDASIGRDMSRKTSRKSGVTINLFQEVTETPIPSGDSFGLPTEGRVESEEHSGRTRDERADLQSFGEIPAFGHQPVGFSGSRDSSGYSGDSTPKRYASRMAKMLGDDLFYEDDANAKVVFGTLRSGQRLETPFSLIVIGDVNPGADLVAGGDIIVFGGLRGTAHASAYDDDAYDRVIIALQMQPMQLRIGSVISRGSDELVRGAEIARIENRRIIVEAFNPRALLGKKFR